MQKVALRSLLFAIAFVAGAAATPRPARAEPAETLQLLRPSTHSLSVLFSIAPAIGVSNALTQFKMSEGIAWHPFGGGSGFALGGELQQSFGGGAFVFQTGPKVWFDFAIVPDIGFYLSPSAMFGIAVSSGNDTTNVLFDMQYGFEAKLILADRGLLFFRPFTLDIAIGDSVALRYDIIFGGGVTF
jgi:hypothetical protein